MKQQFPNILCLCFEDGPPHLGAYGDQLARTPNVDALARAGVVFDNAYTTQPVCGPSRFALLTGIYPEAAAAEDFGTQIGTLPRNFAPYPHVFRDAGYYCTNNEKRNYNSQFDFVELWDETSHQAHWRNRAPGQPFLAVFNGDASHESCLFRAPDNPLYRTVEDGVAPADVRVPAFLPDTPGIRQDIATSYNYLEVVDTLWGERLRELEAEGVADDTIVLVYSDHGGITPRTKRFCYEQGVRVPLIVYIPDKWRHLLPYEPGSHAYEPVSHVDFVPTLLSLIDKQPPPYLQGRAYLGPHRKPPSGYAFSGRNRMDEVYDLVRTVTEGRHRYIRNYSPHRPWGQHLPFMVQAQGYQDWETAHVAGTLDTAQDRFWGTKPFEELYDLDADPDQVINLVEVAASQPVLDELRAALDAHMIAVNDNGLIPEGSPLRGFTESRAGSYPIERVMPVAARAAQRDRANLSEFVTLLDDPDPTVRYWAAQGLLILGGDAHSAAAAIRAALVGEQQIAVRIALAEALILLDNDHDAVRALGLVLDFDENIAHRQQALTALLAVGERARPVVPAIRRMLAIKSRHIPPAAAHILRVLNHEYDPAIVVRTASGGIFNDPELESLVDRESIRA